MNANKHIKNSTLYFNFNKNIKNKIKTKKVSVKR